MAQGRKQAAVDGVATDKADQIRLDATLAQLLLERFARPIGHHLILLAMGEQDLFDGLNAGLPIWMGIAAAADQPC